MRNANFVYLPSIITVPGNYVTRGGEAVTVDKVTNYLAPGQYLNKVHETWDVSGRLHQSSLSQNDIVAAGAMTAYKSQAARDAQRFGYGGPRYWAYLDEIAQEHIGKGVSNALIRSLSEALKGNDGI